MAFQGFDFSDILKNYKPPAPKPAPKKAAPKKAAPKANPYAGGIGGLGAAAMASIKAATSPEAVAKNQARIKAQQAAQAKEIAAGKAQQAAQRAAQDQFVQNLAPPSARDFWGLDEATQNWNNPYYNPNDPRVTNPDKYTRFDYTQPGSGIADSGNLAAAFDRAFLAGNKLVSPIDLSGAGPYAGLLNPDGLSILGGTIGGGGLGGAAKSAIAAGLGLESTPELDKAFKLNTAYDRASTTYRNFLNDKYYQDAFKQLGIDPTSIKTREDLAAINPLQKASVWDIVQRTKQGQNQLPPQGIADSLGGFGGFIGPILGGLVGGPVGGALVGAAQGAFQPGGGLSLIDAAQGGISGYGIGDIIANGIVLPDWAGGGRILDPIATSGWPPNGSLTGIDYTPGGRPAPSYEPWTPPGTGGTPPLPGPQPGDDDWTVKLPEDYPTGPASPNDPAPPVPPPSSTWIPPIIIPGGGTQPPPPIGPVIDDSQPTDPPPDDDGTVPPIVVPPVPPTTPDGGSDPSLPEIPTGPSVTVGAGGGGGGQSGLWRTAPIPGPPEFLPYFAYGSSPFQQPFNRGVPRYG